MTSPADLVVAAALAEWRAVVRDAPTGYSSILRYYHQGLGWTWQRYPAPGAQWCGAFAAWCWRAAGIDTHVRYKRMAGVTRLLGWCRGEQGRKRLVELDAILPGDILLIGGRAGPSHIGLAIDTPDDAGWVQTVEGNSTAELGDGTNGEGVVRRRRPPLEVRPGSRFIHLAIRPLPADLTMPAAAGPGA